jgi:SAM-dependent methyltransferase
LEYIDDVLPAVLSLREKAGTPVSAEKPLRVADFGCGKSYLTFAVHYFLSCVRGVPCDVTGLDLKADVIAYCTRLAATLGAQESLHFAVGDIAEYGENAAPDIVITLHACDTATDYALEYAIRRGAAAILSVPCCQHEINAQIDESRRARTAEAAPATVRTAQPVDSAAVSVAPDSVATARTAFEPLLRHGILKERLAALVTDALRAEYVERAGYKVQVLEFIDMSHTPKNLLLRAVRKSGAKAKPGAEATANGVQTLEAALGIAPTIQRLLAN